MIYGELYDTHFFFKENLQSRREDKYNFFNGLWKGVSLLILSVYEMIRKLSDVSCVGDVKHFSYQEKNL